MIKYIRHLLQSAFKKPTEQKVIGSTPVAEHKTFTETGGFIKSDQFKLIWVDKNVHRKYEATDTLSDDEYIDYKLWEELNGELMYKDYLPDTVVISGKNPNIIFHGGCLGCLSQRLHGLDRCKGCRYFRFRGSIDLHIEGEEAATMSADDLSKIFKRRL